MKLYLTPKTLKKIIKMLILFILACILVYYANTLDVKAADTTFSVNSLDITFPQYVNWYDNVNGTLNSKSTYNYLTAFTSTEDYLYLSQPSSSLQSTANSGGFTLFYSLPVVEGHSYLLYNYFINSSKSAYFSHTSVNSSYRYFQSCTNTSLSSCTNVTSTSSGYLGFTEYGNTYITASFNTFTATKSNHYINISIGSTSTITIPSGNPTIGFIGYRLIDTTTYSDETIQGMIQDNQTSLNNLEDDVAVLQETQEATNDKLDQQIQQDKDQHEAEMEQDKQQHEETMDTITDSSDPDLAIGDTAGWLPPGPVDSVLNLPLTILNSLISNLSNKTCSAVDVPLPYVDKSIQLPCLSTIFDKIGFTSILNTISIPFAIYIYINTLIKLYGWVDKTLQFREEHWNDVDQWGGI